MGKIKRQKKKLHIPATNNERFMLNEYVTVDSAPLLPLSPPKDNLFAGLNIDISSIKNKLVPDDVQSIKSCKSLRSESGKQILSKKEKLKLRKELFLKKIDHINQIKKEKKLREKRTNIALIGDTNPLHDALPSLESLLKSKANIKYKSERKKKKRGIEKATQRKKKLVESVMIFKNTLKNKDFKKNPFEAISSHIKSVVQLERKK